MKPQAGKIAKFVVFFDTSTSSKRKNLCNWLVLYSSSSTDHVGFSSSNSTLTLHPLAPCYWIEQLGRWPKNFSCLVQLSVRYREDQSSLEGTSRELLDTTQIWKTRHQSRPQRHCGTKKCFTKRGCLRHWSLSQVHGWLGHRFQACPERLF